MPSFPMAVQFGLMVLITTEACTPQAHQTQQLTKVSGYLTEALHTYLALIGPVANPPMTVQKTVPVLMPVGNGLQRVARRSVRLSVPDKILVQQRLLMPIQPIQSIPILKQCTKFAVLKSVTQASSGCLLHLVA